MLWACIGHEVYPILNIRGDLPWRLLCLSLRSCNRSERGSRKSWKKSSSVCVELMESLKLHWHLDYSSFTDWALLLSVYFQTQPQNAKDRCCIMQQNRSSLNCIAADKSALEPVYTIEICQSSACISYFILCNFYGRSGLWQS